MSFPPFLPRWSIVFAVLLSAFLVSCGGGSDSSKGTGTVGLMLTDAPTDDFDQINLTITRVELLGEDEEGTRVQLFAGERTIDLLDLRDQAELFSLAEVPTGVYSKIRLTVTDIELVKLNPDTGAVVQTIEPKLPGRDRIDLNPRAPFIINDGDSLILQVDLDARKSIHIIDAGSSELTIFRPVVFVKIIDGAVSARIAKVHGTVAEIDAEGQSFELCGTQVTFHFPREISDDERCLTVQVDDSSSFFKSDGSAGAFEDLVTGGPATVVGHFRHTEDGIELLARVIYLGDDANLAKLKGLTTSAFDAGQFSVDVLRSDDFGIGQDVSVSLPAGAAVFARSGLESTPADIAAGLRARVLGLRTGDNSLQGMVVILSEAVASDTLISGAVGEVTSSAFTLLPSASGNITADTNVCTGVETAIYRISGVTTAAIGLSELTSGWTANVYGHQPLEGCFVAETVVVFQP